jgi:16S rRNA G966 N2-methylase RsmD
MTTETIKIDDLTPYERNARHHEPVDIDAIAKSIEAFGFRDPVGVWGPNNIIVEGHGRVMAAKQLGMTEVPCIRLDDLTDEQRRAYGLAHNKTAELSTWDAEMLPLELQDLPTYDMMQFGFSDVPAAGDAADPVIEEDDFDEDTDEVEAQTKPGALYLLGGVHRLICGDSTDPAVIDKLLGGQKPDMVLTDPPYGINAVGNNGEVGADFGVAKKGKYKPIIADDTTDTAADAYNVLAALCDKLVLWGGNYFGAFLPPSDSWLVWDKRCDSGIKNTFADGEMAWCSFHTPVRIYHQLWNGMIREGEHDKRVHPTQKPVRMLSEIIKDFTDEHQSVLDVFGGSGSTLIACEQTGRQCFMCELDPHYCDVIIARWEKLTGKKAELVRG